MRGAILSSYKANKTKEIKAMTNTENTKNTKKYLSLKMRANYYRKSDCVQAAEDIVAKKQITGMSVRQLAAEIYTHAMIYYNFPILPDRIRNTKFMQRAFRSASNGIDLEDNGDSWKRRFCYSLIWSFC